MAINLVGTNSLFDRLGLIGRTLAQINLDQSTNVPIDVQALADQFGEADRLLTDNLQTQLRAYQNSMLGFANYLSGVAKQIVINMVNEVSPQPTQNIVSAIQEVIAEMKAAGLGVERSTVDYTITAADTNHGADATVVVSLKEKTGLELMNLLQEDIVLSVSSDSQEGGASLGSETLRAQGEFAATNVLDYTWPAGSASSGGITACSPYLNAAGGNLLTNSSFVKLTGGNASNWVYDEGAPQITADVTAAGSLCYSTGLSFAGDDSTLTAISQQFGSRSTGTVGALFPWRQYAVNLTVGMGDVIPTSGILEIALVDVATGVTVCDDQGMPDSIQLNLTTLVTGCHSISGVFRTPRAFLPAISPVKLVVRLVTPLSTGSSIEISHLALCQMVELYAYGPSIAVFSGDSALVRNDSWTIRVTNDRAGLWHTLWERLFSMSRNRLQLPGPGEAGTAGTDESITMIDDSVLSPSTGSGGSCSLSTLTLEQLFGLALTPSGEGILPARMGVAAETPEEPRRGRLRAVGAL